MLVVGRHELLRLFALWNTGRQDNTGPLAPSAALPGSTCAWVVHSSACAVPHGAGARGGDCIACHGPAAASAFASSWLGEGLVPDLLALVLAHG